MKFTKFANIIKSHRDAGKAPTNRLFPRNIKLSSRIWQYILNLQSFTSKYGYEHSISFYWVDGDIIATSPTKGSKTRVTSKEKINLKYKPKIRDWYDKLIIINGKTKLKKQVKAKDIPEQIKIVQLFNVHSHPAHTEAEQEKYSFFSGTDINSLARSQSFCSGLVTDELLLACQHDSSPTILTDQEKIVLNKINQHYFHSKTIPDKIVASSNFVFYRARFKKKLNRLN